MSLFEKGREKTGGRTSGTRNKFSKKFDEAAIRAWGRDLRWAWPRDGKRETLEGAGIALADQYREQGLNMLREHAQFEDGSVSVEAGLMAMLDRMRTGKLKVFKEHLIARMARWSKR